MRLRNQGGKCYLERMASIVRVWRWGRNHRRYQTSFPGHYFRNCVPESSPYPACRGISLTFTQPKHRNGRRLVAGYWVAPSGVFTGWVTRLVWFQLLRLIQQGPQGLSANPSSSNRYDPLWGFQGSQLASGSWVASLFTISLRVGRVATALSVTAVSRERLSRWLVDHPATTVAEDLVLTAPFIVAVPGCGRRSGRRTLVHPGHLRPPTLGPSPRPGLLDAGADPR
jgi:hypothetical protein